MKNYINILLTIFLLSCSSGNPVAPNTSSLTNLSKNPSPTTEAPVVKKINLNGKVIDSITSKPIENANILIYSIVNENIVNLLKDSNNIKSNEEKKSNSDKENSLGTSSSPSPFPSKTPSNKQLPDIKGSPNPSESPKLLNSQENEEEIKTDEKTKIDEEKKSLDLSLINSLSKIKPNDIEEFKATTGNDGKFWIKNVPENNIIITVSAKGYKSLSIFSFDYSKVEDILLEPIDINDKLSSFEGVVVSAIDNPVENATIGHSFYTSEFYGLPSNSDKNGIFKIDTVLIGERLFVANLKDDSGKIISMGMNNFNVKKIKENKKEDNKESTKNTIKLKSVTKYVTFKGKVSLEKESKLRNINVYIAFKKKGKPKEEVFLTEYLINDNVENFNLSLPELEEGYYYHLEFIASDKNNNLVYHHENNLKKEQKEMNITFISPITNIASDFIKNSSNEKLPVFTWTPVDNISFYRLSISKVDKEDNISTIWSGITPFNLAIYPINIKNDKDNKYIWTVTGIKESKEKNNYEKLSFSKFNLSSWSDLTNSISQEIVFSESDTEIKEIEENKE
jgi:hypothetical protein